MNYSLLLRRWMISLTLVVSLIAAHQARAESQADLTTWKTCRSDADCVRAEGVCATPDAVSREHAEEYRAFVLKVAPEIRCVNPECCHSLAFENATKGQEQGVHCCQGQCQFVVTAEVRAQLPAKCASCGTADTCKAK